MRTFSIGGGDLYNSSGTSTTTTTIMPPHARDNNDDRSTTTTATNTTTSSNSGTSSSTSKVLYTSIAVVSCAKGAEAANVLSDRAMTQTINSANDVASSWMLPTVFSTTTQLQNPKKKLVVQVLLALIIICTSLIVSLYTLHRGFRRSCQFWMTAYPLVLEFRVLKFHAKYICGCKSEKELQLYLKEYHKRTAPKVLDSIQRLRGIYIKIGQFLSTVGSGLLDEEYVKALRPLQDGLEPRSYDAIVKIIEDSTGKKMEDIFETFEEAPIGAASVAQAHRAKLKRQNVVDTSFVGGRMGDRRGKKTGARDSFDEGTGYDDVVVKVQYPEVAELFHADMKNLELLTKLLSPQNIDIIRNARKRHALELDFRIEAQNLEECTKNMQQHGLEPRLIRIPRVRNETGICTKHVLVMEYLDGVPLWDAIEREQDRVARALGKKNGEELRFIIAQQMKEHFEKGGAGGECPEMDMRLLGIGGGGCVGGRVAAKLLQTAGPWGATLLRQYAGVKEGVDNFLATFQRGFAQALGGATNTAVTTAHMMTMGGGGDGNDDASFNGNSDLYHIQKQQQQLQQQHEQQPRHKKIAHVNLRWVLKTLIKVHGLQMIHDGVFNADPHPGNVLILPDGRLGLLDYGMVGRLDEEERDSIARTVVALANHDEKEAARIYTESGYSVSWREGKITNAKMLHRLASSHLDKIDLSPIKLYEEDDATHSRMVRKIDVREVLRTLRVHHTPSWILQVRRLGRLLMGVSAQAARPMSLAKEWEHIAIESLNKRNNSYNHNNYNNKQKRRQKQQQKQEQRLARTADVRR